MLKPTKELTLEETQTFIKRDSQWLCDLQLQFGAILFRGFPAKSASDFNDFVNAFGFEHLPYIGGAAVRNQVVGNVFTTNESPPDQVIGRRRTKQK